MKTARMVRINERGGMSMRRGGRDKAKGDKRP